MNTDDRIKRYTELHKTDPGKAKIFLEENRSDKRFVAIVNLYNEILPALLKQKDYWIDSLNSAMQETDPSIQVALIDSVKEEVCHRAIKEIEKKRERDGAN